MVLSHSKVVVLDRDGVINEDSDEFIKSPAEWRPLPGSLDAIARLHQAGFTVTVATNQSGVGRGLFSLEMLAAIHQEMLARITSAGGHIARLVFCPHTPEDHCECRKPAPGMLYEIAELTGCGLGNMIVIGDAARDIEAAHNAGSRAILVRTGKGRATEAARLTADERIEVYDNLAAAAEALLLEAGTKT
jgi:D-glycero-D-manno-heptose 1,7-bisphosphate phosphatase